MNNNSSSANDQLQWNSLTVCCLVVVGVGCFILILGSIFDYYQRQQRELSESAANNAPSVHVVIQRDAPAPLPPSVFPFYKAAAAAARSGCAVCISDFEDGEEAEQLPGCGHVFHRRCIDPWLMIHPTCPICRNSAPPPPVARPAPLANH